MSPILPKYETVEAVLWRRAGIVKVGGMVLLSQFCTVLIAASTRVPSGSAYAAVWNAITIPEKTNILTTSLILLWAVFWNDKSIIPPGQSNP